MDNAIIGVLVGSSITLVVSLITSYFNRSNLKLQLKQQDRTLTISKLETLYEMILQLQLNGLTFVNKTQDYFGDNQKNPKDKLYWQKWDEIFLILANPLPKIITLADIYAFELKPMVNDLQRIKIELEKCAQGYIVKNPKCTQNDLDRGLKIFHNVCNNLLNGIRLKTDINISNIQVIPDNLVDE